jgi:hypothetical protein
VDQTALRWAGLPGPLVHTIHDWRLAPTPQPEEWEGLGLLSGSSINDIATALSSFCSQYSTKRWGDLLRQELPELTDEDIEWLCGLTETMESHEPAIVHKDPGRITHWQPMTRTITGKRRRKSKGEGTATSSHKSREAVPLSAPADAAAPVTGRKRTALWHLTHLFLLGGHHDCLLSNQRPGVARAPNQSSIVSQTRSVLRSLDSHHHLRYWLLLNDLIAYSFQEPPREIFTVPVPVRFARCLFCRLLPLFCSLLANIILPLGRTNSLSSRRMIECPQRTGKQSRFGGGGGGGGCFID